MKTSKASQKKNVGLWLLLCGMFFSLLNVGCSISSYSHVSKDQEPQQVLNRFFPQPPIHFFFYTGVKKLPKGTEGSLPIEFEILRRLLELVGRPIMTEAPPEQGIYVLSYKTTKPLSTRAQLFGWFCGITLNIIPCYSGSSGWKITYTIYRDGKSEKSYSYKIIQKKFSWIGLIPFSWINFLVPQYEHAFTETTHRFLLDLQRDKYWDGESLLN